MWPVASFLGLLASCFGTPIRTRRSSDEVVDGHGHKSFGREFFIIFLCPFFPGIGKSTAAAEFVFFISTKKAKKILRLLSLRRIFSNATGGKCCQTLQVVGWWTSRRPGNWFWQPLRTEQRFTAAVCRNNDSSTGGRCPGAEKDKNKIMINEGTLMVTFNDFSFSGLQLRMCLGAGSTVRTVVMMYYYQPLKKLLWSDMCVFVCISDQRAINVMDSCKTTRKP